MRTITRTDVMKSDEFTFVRSISKFSERPEKAGQFFASQQFVINGHDDKMTMWHILVYLDGRVPGNSNFESIFTMTPKK